MSWNSKKNNAIVNHTYTKVGSNITTHLNLHQGADIYISALV